MFLCLALAACAGERSAAPDELAGVHDGKTAAVLLRFVMVDQHGARLNPFDRPIVQLIFGRVRFAMGDFDSGGAPTKGIRSEGPTPIEIGQKTWSARYSYVGRFLSKAARDEGWMALFLPPGYYYVSVYAKDDCGPDNQLCLDWLPQWRIEVPSGVPLVYAGTFRLSDVTDWLSTDRLDQAATRIASETEVAIEFARRDLPSLPPPVARPAVRHTGPYLLGIPAAAATP